MKTAPITAATIEFDAEGVPFAPTFGDRYHAQAGALAQAEHVFLRGNGLPQRWAGRTRFVILETGFGLGNNFLATWEAWRRDAHRCERLHFVSVEKHPPRREDLARVHAGSSLAALAQDLRMNWPPLTGDLHRLTFEQGRVELLLALGDAATWLRRLQLQADAIYLDGFAPDRNAAMWSAYLFAALPRLCAPGATAATWSVAREVRDGLARHGFEVERAPGFAGKREMTVARFAPHHRAAPNARLQAAMPAARDAIVVGAGLAGAATALALAEQGLEVTVLEAAGAAAAGASGNPAALVRSLYTRDDGAHVRWHRAAALEAQRQIAPLVAAGIVRGRMAGMLHLDDDAGEMQRRLAVSLSPPEHVQALGADEAAQRAGLPGIGPAWFFPGGGWVDAAALVRHWIGSSGAALRTGCTASTLSRRGERWQVHGPEGLPWAEADIVVLANGADAQRLAPQGCGEAWALVRSRGQITHVGAGGAGMFAPQLPNLPTLPTLPTLPLARNGYVIPLPGGSVLCGATQSADDDEPALREADHGHNLALLRRLTGQAFDATQWSVLGGWVGWRCHSTDRLPLVGPLPARDASMRTAATPGGRLAQPRHVPREPGLFVLTALGSRGVTGAALGARTLAAFVCGAPSPIDTDLLDAIDAARDVSRNARRAPDQ